MNPLSSVATGIRKERDTHVRYEVHREREPGQMGVERPPITEEFYGLDRARIAALGYALDGPTSTGDRLTGVVRIEMVLSNPRGVARRTLIDVIDERVAWRVLNEVQLPRADQLAVSLEQLQAEFRAL
jgi:hypothetical protein